MGEAREFKPLEDLGAVPLGERSELRFYVDEYKGHKYGSIRTFLTAQGEGYSGPTKSGVTLNARLLDEVLAALSRLEGEPAREERELGRWPKKPGVELVARITLYKEEPGVDLREWVDEPEYKGWSKKGVRLPYPELAGAIERLRRMKAFVAGA